MAWWRIRPNQALHRTYLPPLRCGKSAGELRRWADPQKCGEIRSTYKVLLLSLMELPIALTLLVISVAVAGCAANEPTKVVRKAVPGSLSVAPMNVAKWDISVNRTYDQLSPEDRASFRKYYEGLPEDCEPPFPSQGLEPIIRNLMAGQERAEVRGDLFAVASLDKNGDVQSVSFPQEVSPEMSLYVAAVLMHEKFKPAMCNGKPLDSEFPLRVRLRVK